ncbi:hypothetical protein A2473_00415 [candidate division WWE3 bacterium RIFOXYC2_FULL_42_13]|uniref:TGS domain-containing protein n=2 Tax=Katanobacteria TaxID=422282 RepID=A0A3D0ZPG7_UNCKA|nr:MAG: hypothetical protein A2337_04120 [candidate division WWE3 bacterium RIFOXYB2_FULL_43_9]OGC74088.1 MAG: hypothetical protein A2473_00415 [candidate division WWE3 bacterium RIFOXYC2_FULL_42_13]OGC74722.1 MAG: hypothetical protein A2547_00210 [candidate division WWE3 bacterium RIFOXYD2_FULL_43_10]HBY10054.1 hypothetical protein [candidate division WWE3 bacterium]HCC42185.1 hypothetical protein [candidate division WWE3 bacterium]
MTDKNVIEKAGALALKIHENHTRLSGEGYYWHLHRVAELLEENNVNDPEILAGAYLHHILDSKKYSKDDLKKDFSPEIAEIVFEYARISGNEISSIDPKNYNESIIVQTYLNLIKNPKTLIIRLADKVDNIRSAYVLPKENARRVAEKAMYLYSPICQLLGIHRFVVELENEAFKILNPGEYYSIEAYLKKKMPEMESVLEDTAEFIRDILGEKGIPAKLDYRIKHIYSIYRKAQKYRETKNYKGLNQIYDIAAMRVLVDSVEQCYMTEDILKQAWSVVPNERDDYIMHPKPSGYRSIHNTFAVSPTMNLEIQIKTREMHEENEFGIASHTFYKTGEQLKKSFQTSPNWLADISFIKNKGELRIDQFKKYVYVFTPKGDIKQLARGATPVDFAYSIHKDLGNACVGVTVNGDFQKLSYELKDGDRVEIKTLKHKKLPSPDWLDFVKTRKGREEIRKALRKDSERKELS